MPTLQRIFFNIWDDYDDEDSIMEHRETHGYVEEYDVLTDDEKLAVTKLVFERLNSMDLEGARMRLVGNEIVFEQLTHDCRERIASKLQSMDIQFRGVKVDVISES